MKRVFIWVALLATVACSRYEQNESVNVLQPKKSYHASMCEQVSRVSMGDDFSLHFDKDDAVSLFVTTDNCKYIFAGAQGDKSGDFVAAGEYQLQGSALSCAYALYPYSATTTISQQGVITATYPSEQSYLENSVGVGANMMVAATTSVDDTNISFRNLCGYLCLQFYGNNVTLRSIKIKGNADEKLAGNAQIKAQHDADPKVELGSDMTHTVTLNLGDGVKLSQSASAPTKFVLALPPTTFERGFTVTATDAEGKIFVKSTDKQVALPRNVVQSMKAVEVVTAEAQIEGLTAPESISLLAQSISAQSISVGSTAEAVTLALNEAWCGVVGSVDVAKGAAKSVAIWYEPNFSTAERTTTLTVTGVESGVSVNIPIVQAPYFTAITEAFPARLETQSSSYDKSKWTSNGICSPLNSSAVLCAVSPNGRTLTYTTSSGPGVANMEKGDYLLYAIPTKGIAAGEQIDFMCTLAAMAENSPKYFIFEYWDDGEWKSVERDLLTAKEDASIKYSFYCKLFESAHNTTFTQSFTLSKPVVDGCVKVRLRTLSSGAGGIRVPSANGYMGMYMINYPNAQPISDTKRILFVGNSFTYYYGTAFMFKELARTQGHQVDAQISVKGSQDFTEHLKLPLTIEAIQRGGYNYAILQDSSPNPAIYADEGGAEILAACKAINDLTLTYSPSCQIVYERTWACPYENYRGYGSYDKLDYLLKKGSEMLKQELEHNIIVSPIGLGFRLGREQNLELLFTDNRHQSRIGAYMKACINYLFIYGERFNANVSNCGVDAATAQIVRQIAERVVFEDVEENYDFSEPVKEDAANCYIVDKAGQYSFRADIMGNGNIPTGSAITSAKLAGKGAKVLWSSYNTATAPTSDSELIDNVTLKDGIISFTTAAGGFKNGNVVIALYDDAECKGEILWSWHIWLCDNIKEQQYNGLVWLDRNLGALAAEAGNPLNIGFYYQFGRKDPFRCGTAVGSTTPVATTGSWPDVTATIPSSPEAYVIANPQQLIARDKDPRDWFATSTSDQNNALWNSSGKTMYDPCPKGYRVPERYAWNVGHSSGTPFFDASNFVYDSATACRIYRDGSQVVVYPIAGCTSASGAITNIGKKGYYRTGAQASTAKYADILEITTSAIETSSGNYRGSGYSVRCVKE